MPSLPPSPLPLSPPPSSSPPPTQTTPPPPPSRSHFRIPWSAPMNEIGPTPPRLSPRPSLDPESRITLRSGILSSQGNQTSEWIPIITKAVWRLNWRCSTRRRFRPSDRVVLTHVQLGPTSRSCPACFCQPKAKTAKHSVPRGHTRQVPFNPPPLHLFPQSSRPPLLPSSLEALSSHLLFLSLHNSAQRPAAIRVFFVKMYRLDRPHFLCHEAQLNHFRNSGSLASLCSAQSPPRAQRRTSQPTFSQQLVKAGHRRSRPPSAPSNGLPSPALFKASDRLQYPKLCQRFLLREAETALCVFSSS